MWLLAGRERRLSDRRAVGRDPSVSPLLAFVVSLSAAVAVGSCAARPPEASTQAKATSSLVIPRLMGVGRMADRERMKARTAVAARRD
jgi:hypothetical protein